MFSKHSDHFEVVCSPAKRRGLSLVAGEPSLAVILVSRPDMSGTCVTSPLAIAVGARVTYVCTRHQYRVTRRAQNPPAFGPCGFESLPGHLAGERQRCALR